LHFTPPIRTAETAASEANVSDKVDSRDDGLREVEQRADQVAREAENAREENLRGTQRGQETDYDSFRLPPDVAEADRVRAADDVELNARQEEVAETQRRAAETLRRNAESLHAGAESLERASEAARDSRRDVSEIHENVEDLRAQVAQARDRVHETDIPRVDEGSDRRG
jgi:methyl-accepting chemotaxis protein